MTGFGTFPGHADNPTGRLIAAQAVDGEVVAASLPVSWARMPRLLDELVTEHRPRLLCGFGIAGHGPLRVEIAAHDRADGRLDADGQRTHAGSLRGDGHPVRRSELDGPALAGAISTVAPAEVSQDAGRYLCNAWLLHALAHSAWSVFVHIPAGSDDRLVADVMDATVDHLRRSGRLTAGR